MTIPRKLALLVVAITITAGATNALWGGTLTVIPIPSWLSGTNDNQGRAVSPDGKYVVGVSGTSALGGYMYDVASGTVIQPNAAGAAPSVATGIAYRTDPVSAQQQLVIDGMSAGYQANWMTTDGGATWGAKRRDTAYTSATVLPVANSLGAVAGSDKFYQVIRDTARSRLYCNQGSNTWDSVAPPWFTNNIYKSIPSGDFGSLNGVSASGRAVGYRITASVGSWRQNYVLDYPPSSALAWHFNGLAGTTEGEAFSIDPSGTNIFGHSPVLDGRFGKWGYKAVVTTALNSLQTVDELPNFPDTDGLATGTAAVPYGCSADGRYAVGMSYRGQEKAVLWDTAGTDTNNWTVVDLTDLATSEGILGNFTRLYRAYSVGVNGAGNPVITGVGTYFDGAGTYVRGFVMVVGTVQTPAPQPKITSISGAGTGSVTVNYTNTVAGTNYTLQYNTNLISTTNWFTVGTKSAGGTSDSQTDGSATGTQRYYRIWVQ